MSASPVVISQKAIYLNADTLVHTANNLRRVTDTLAAPGVQDIASWLVRQRVAGANMSVDVTTAAAVSRAYVRGSSTTEQGLYLVHNVAQGTGTIDALYNVDISAADPTNPRIDQVFLCVEDAQHAGANNQATIRVVTGTPTGGATLDNRTGVGAAPAGMSSELLADVLVSAAVGSILGAAIRDRRRVGNFGTIPWLGSTGLQWDAVCFEPHPATPLSIGGATMSAAFIAAATHDSMQAAALMWLPRRIVGATRVRWRYLQGGTAAATNYVLFIADASGRIVAATAATAFAGALNTATEASIALLATTTFEAGWYYVAIGVAPMTASSTVYYSGVVTGTGNLSNALGAPYRNVTLRSATGSTTPPTTILAYSDSVTLSAAQHSPMVPIIGLSTA